jgi:hypothetical protein
MLTCTSRETSGTSSTTKGGQRGGWRRQSCYPKTLFHIFFLSIFKVEAFFSTIVHMNNPLWKNEVPVCIEKRNKNREKFVTEHFGSTKLF